MFNEYTTGEERGDTGLSSDEVGKRIAAKLEVSIVTVNVNLLYLKVVYNLRRRTANARRCERYRMRKRV